MRKFAGIAAVLVLCCAGPVRATILGFETGATFYEPRDSRYQGIGTDVGINMKVDDALTMGYRVEELAMKGNGSATASNDVIVNSNLTFQGITASYRTFSADDAKVAGDIGLWMGSATAPSIDTAGTALTSPFVEPSVKLSYTTVGKIETMIKTGVGYRFVRNINDATPFGAGSSPLKDFDGLDFNLSIGLLF